ASSGSSSECSPIYGQCGGKHWQGTTCCAEGSTCVPQENNEYYSQCLPGVASSKTTTTAAAQTTTTEAPKSTTTAAPSKTTTTDEVEVLTTTSSSAAATSTSDSSSGSDYAAVSGGKAGDGSTTRYWDCCKASCSWPDKASVSSPVSVCAADGVTLADANEQSGCNGGGGYMCTDNQPWEVNENLSYGFAAASIAGLDESGWCCGCYELTFTSGEIDGKKMVVQVTNTGGDLGSNHFDLQIPGGGVGIFNGCESQWNAPSNGWGERYGGLNSASGCTDLPKQLQAGCEWRFNWFKNANNPSVSFKEVTCPSELTKKTGCSR
ncbi:RlpA-like double-psi beta-barrel-protein domain-containing protein-containing protein, partial [Zychaea mexicana]|uniref:RlpA-like double-psi beta-barrel-protein domain-containing protein-containing protein n=1 Tax=Zychaea mexicana TaxID=64656 RepID=UPI0022FF2A10